MARSSTIILIRHNKVQQFLQSRIACCSIGILCYPGSHSGVRPGNVLEANECMEVIRHDHIADHRGFFMEEIIKPFVNSIGSFYQFKQRLPPKAGKGDKVNVDFRIEWLHPDGHSRKIKRKRIEASGTE